MGAQMTTHTRQSLEYYLQKKTTKNPQPSRPILLIVPQLVRSSNYAQFGGGILPVEGLLAGKTNFQCGFLFALSYAIGAMVSMHHIQGERVLGKLYDARFETLQLL
ncbi:unnamed protein product [Clavelina lepadiformis]|uniref:Uncharacterized protein n=1 Tax=Clavelina lepadiformis TaxID=159417 RepID=A0ABP0GVI3_CLALP